jgi:hypothetical protein
MTNENHDDDDDYEVGYRKPPRHTRFKPGRSGNPKGRRKKNTERECFDALFVRTADAPITINVDGRKRTVSTMEAVVLLQIRKALKGDPRAVKAVFDLNLRAEAYRQKMIKDEHQRREEEHREHVESMIEFFSELGSMFAETKDDAVESDPAGKRLLKDIKRSGD